MRQHRIPDDLVSPPGGDPWERCRREDICAPWPHRDALEAGAKECICPAIGTTAGCPLHTGGPQIELYGSKKRWQADFECGVIYELGDDTSGRRCVTPQSMMLPGTPSPHPMFEVYPAAALDAAKRDLHDALDLYQRKLDAALQREADLRSKHNECLARVADELERKNDQIADLQKRLDVIRAVSEEEHYEVCKAGLTREGARRHELSDCDNRIHNIVAERQAKP